MIQSAFIVAMACQFISSLFWPNMLLGGLKKKLNFIPQVLYKPIFDCPICMTPYYGGLLMLLFQKDLTGNVFLTLLTAAGINTVIVFIRKNSSSY